MDLHRAAECPARGRADCSPSADAAAPYVSRRVDAVRDLSSAARHASWTWSWRMTCLRSHRRSGMPVGKQPRFGTAERRAGWRSDRRGGSAAESATRAPGALPGVEAATLDEDLLRRDFTVNAIAVALDGDDPGQVRSAPGRARRPAGAAAARAARAELRRRPHAVAAPGPLCSATGVRGRAAYRRAGRRAVAAQCAGNGLRRPHRRRAAVGAGGTGRRWDTRRDGRPGPAHRAAPAPAPGSAGTRTRARAAARRGRPTGPAGDGRADAASGIRAG